MKWYTFFSLLMFLHPQSYIWNVTSAILHWHLYIQIYIKYSSVFFIYILTCTLLRPHSYIHSYIRTLRLECHRQFYIHVFTFVTFYSYFTTVFYIFIFNIHGFTSVRLQFGHPHFYIPNFSFAVNICYSHPYFSSMPCMNVLHSYISFIFCIRIFHSFLSSIFSSINTILQWDDILLMPTN